MEWLPAWDWNRKREGDVLCVQGGWRWNGFPPGIETKCYAVGINIILSVADGMASRLGLKQDIQTARKLFIGGCRWNGFPPGIETMMHCRVPGACWSCRWNGFPP